MANKRYYFDGKIDTDTIVLSDAEFHHLSGVMRTKVGETVEIFNGDGFVYSGIVKIVGKKDATIKITGKNKSHTEPRFSLDVYQALAKGDKLSLITQKLTELGVSNIYFATSKYCDVTENSHKPERMSSIAISACKQCKRTTIPKICGVVSIAEICKNVKNYDKFYVFYENEDNLLFKTELLKLNDTQKIAYLVGPEGGFTQTEIDQLKNAGAIVVSLGSIILRTETAAICAASCISQILQ